MALLSLRGGNTSRYRVSLADAPAGASVASQNKGAMNRVTAALMVFSFLLMGFFGGLAKAPEAKAWVAEDLMNILCASGSFLMDAEPSYLTPDDLLPSDNPVQGDRRTLYERIGMAGSWYTTYTGAWDPAGYKDDGSYSGKSVVAKAGGDDSLNDSWAKIDQNSNPLLFNQGKICVDIMGNAGAAAGNFFLVFSKINVVIAGSIYQVATESVASFLEGISVFKDVGSALYDNVFVKFMSVIVMLSAVSVLASGIMKRQSTLALQQAGWVLIAACLGYTSMFNPTWISDLGNKVVSTATNAINTSISGALLNDSPEGAANVCYVASMGVVDNPDTAEDDRRGNTRTTQCLLWSAFVYSPWTVGQFGFTPGSEDDKFDTLTNPVEFSNMKDFNTTIPKFINPATQSMSEVKLWSVYWLDNKVMIDGEDDSAMAYRSLLQATGNLLTSAGGEDTVHPTLKGQSGWDRIGVASLSMIASLAACVMIVILGFSVIILEIGFLMMMMLAPIFLLIGIAPVAGKAILMTYLNTLLDIVIKRIVMTVFLTIMVGFYGVIIQNTVGDGWLLSLILIIAVSIGVFQYKNDIVRIFNRFNLPGAEGRIEGKAPPGWNAFTTGAAAFAGAALPAMLKGAAGSYARNRAAKAEAAAQVDNEYNSPADGGAGPRTGGDETPLDEPQTNDPEVKEEDAPPVEAGGAGPRVEENTDDGRPKYEKKAEERERAVAEAEAKARAEAEAPLTDRELRDAQRRLGRKNGGKPVSEEEARKFAEQARQRALQRKLRGFDKARNFNNMKEDAAKAGVMLRNIPIHAGGEFIGMVQSVTSGPLAKLHEAKGAVDAQVASVAGGIAGSAPVTWAQDKFAAIRERANEVHERFSLGSDTYTAATEAPTAIRAGMDRASRERAAERAVIENVGAPQRETLSEQQRKKLIKERTRQIIADNNKKQTVLNRMVQDARKEIQKDQMARKIAGNVSKKL